MYLESLFVLHGLVEALTVSHSPTCQICTTSLYSIPTSDSPQHQFHPLPSLAMRSAQALPKQPCLTASALDGSGVCTYLMKSEGREEQQKSVLRSERAFCRKDSARNSSVHCTPRRVVFIPPSPH